VARWTRRKTFRFDGRDRIGYGYLHSGHNSL
jgi:hypothetical protein